MKHLILSFLLVALTLFKLSAQSNIGIGTISVPSFSDKKTVLVVDADNGKLKGFSQLKEDVFIQTVNKEKTLVYALSRHFIFSIDINTGKLVDEYQIQDILTKKESDLIDPNLYKRTGIKLRTTI
jgi:hypothetical protein